MPRLKATPAGEKTTIGPSERLASSAKHLAVTAIDMKSAGDELCDNIVPLDRALAKFDLGVSGWFAIAGNQHEDGSYWSREIGYARVGKKWGIALKKVEGRAGDEYDDEEVWLFKDAPRWMQIESVTKIPDLFDTLIKRAEDTISKLKRKSL
ncbi:MAG: hypothetical protein LAP87_30200 [Acidobacteriia bacterium]|nr:hypothetical protein [Terriglobia bacterium]